MALVLLFTFYGAGAALVCILVSGWKAASAREYLTRAVILAQEGKFEDARKAALVAVRQNSSYKSNPDVQTLYDIIVLRVGANPDRELERIRLAIPQWPKNKWEKVTGGMPMKVAVVTVIVVEVLLKLLSHS